MDLDDLKNKSKNIKAPGVNFERGGSRVGSLDDLIDAMKAEDARDKIMIRRMMLFFSIAGIIYASLFILMIFFPPDGGYKHYPLAIGLYALIFLAIVVFFSRKSKILEKIDYSLPVLIFLKESEKRYRFFQRRDYLFAVPVWIVLIYLGGLYIINATDRYFGPEHRPVALAIYAAFMIIVFIMGYSFSWQNWKKQKEPIRNEIIMMKAELSANESKV